MRVIKFVMGLLILMAPLATAQDMQWQSMDGPYYVYDVTGISTGMYGTQMCVYMVASDLSTTKIYRYQDSSPISKWDGFFTRPGAKHVNASRNNSRQAYATVPDQEGLQSGVLYTENGGVDWGFTQSQPGNKAFTCIETHPGNPEICFTGGELIIGPTTSIWSTENHGVSWNEVGTNNHEIDPRDRANSVRIDPNSGTSIGNTVVYTCYINQGIWRNPEGGNGEWQGLSLLQHQTGYTGIDVAVKEGNSDCIFLLAEISGEYTVWHSDDGGENWEGYYGDPGPFYSFGTDPVNKIIVGNYHDDEVLWVISPNTIYTCIKFDDNHIEWANTPGEFQCLDFDIGASVPAGVVYAGLKSSIKQVSANWSSHFDQYDIVEVTKGTNIADIASLHSIIGSQLDALSDNGGFVFQNQQIEQPLSADDWETIDYLKRQQVEPNDGEVIGDRLITYYMDDGINFVASGHDDSRPYLSDGGSAVIFGDEIPERFKALAGPLAVNPNYIRPYAAGTDDYSKNVVYAVYYNPPDPEIIKTFDNFSTDPPVISDMICEKSTESPNYYICGTRSSEQADIVLYIDVEDSPHSISELNSGLDIVRQANSIVKSPEIRLLDFYPIIYLGTEKGIYKTYFNGTAMPWQNVSTGIDLAVEIIDLANYGQGIDYPYYKPDSLVEYALGKDEAGLPYIYISADSGRSWIEGGGYLREHALSANAITTISDIRDESHDPYFLAVGTDRGIYRLPYNVKSGPLADDESWGPGLVIVNGDVTVPQGRTLEIVGPCTLKFVYSFDKTHSGEHNDVSELIVDGSLVVSGTEGNPVVFTSSRPSNPLKGDWAGISVRDYAHLDMDYGIIEYAVDAIVAIKETDIAISNCEIKNNKTTAITAICPEMIRVFNTEFTDNNLYAINVVSAVHIAQFSHPNEELQFYAENNVIMNYYYGTEIVYSQDTFSIAYNDYWNNVHDFRTYSAVIDTTGIIHTDPMFTDSNTFQLQMFSPLIDAGDPSILDEDSTRSDIGAWGGPYGRSYQYIDYPPRIPDSLVGLFTGDSIKIHWRYNTEADFNSYFLYRDTISAFTPSGLNLLAQPETSLYVDLNFDTDHDYYYRISARDNQGNFSDYSAELAVITSDISPGNNLPSDLSLGIKNTYPNPFNSSAMIKYYLPDVGFQPAPVELNIYDIQGRLVRKLINTRQYPGYHEIIWDGCNDDKKEVISGVYLVRLVFSGIELTKPRKITLLR